MLYSKSQVKTKDILLYLITQEMSHLALTISIPTHVMATTRLKVQ